MLEKLIMDYVIYLKTQAQKENCQQIAYEQEKVARHLSDILEYCQKGEKDD